MGALLAAMQGGAALGTIAPKVGVRLKHRGAVVASGRGHALHQPGQPRSGHVEGKPGSRLPGALLRPASVAGTVPLAIHVAALSVFAITIHGQNLAPGNSLAEESSSESLPRRQAYQPSAQSAYNFTRRNFRKLRHSKVFLRVGLESAPVHSAPAQASLFYLPWICLKIQPLVGPDYPLRRSAWPSAHLSRESQERVKGSS